MLDLAMEIPAYDTPETPIVPASEEVEPWIDAIMNLWDNTALHSELSERGKVHANRWFPETIVNQYDDVLPDWITVHDIIKNHETKLV